MSKASIPLLIRPMRRPELDLLVDWAADEGWNPGLDDAEVFWNTDPDGFIAAERGGEFIGGGSIVSYGGAFGFMGFFIVRSDLRGQGLGDRLWHARRDRLIGRLNPPAVIGMDGVFDMQHYYAKGGFEFLGRDLRFELPPGTKPGMLPGGAAGAGLVDLADLPFDEVCAYDRRHFPAPRKGFLRPWIARPGGAALGVMTDGELAGMAVRRPCRTGHKIGPLFADTPEIADTLFRGIAAGVEDDALYLDVPECNADALALTGRYGMEEVFGCARMVYGPAPELPMDRIYGVTTFELG